MKKKTYSSRIAIRLAKPSSWLNSPSEWLDLAMLFVLLMVSPTFLLSPSAALVVSPIAVAEESESGRRPTAVR